MDCFYPINSCGSVIALAGGQSTLSGRPPRSDKKKRGKNKRDERQDLKRSSRSKSRDRHRQSQSSPPSRKLTKRVGAAYKRLDESIITSAKTSLHQQDGIDETTANCSAETYTTGGSGSSESTDLGDEEDFTDASATMTQDYTKTSAMETVDNSPADNRSVSTENVANKSGLYSWFQPTLHKRFQTNKHNFDKDPTSPSSVGAVRNSVKSKFDYIRKTQKFSGYLDPPSDQSVKTTVSVKADDDGSILSNGMGHHLLSHQFSQYRAQRKNELAKQILQRRNGGVSVLVSRSGYDP